MIALLLVLLALAMLTSSAFCSGLETCLLSVSRDRILHMARSGGRKARIIQAALTDLGHTLTTILIGNNLSNVAYSTATAALSVEWFGDDVTAGTIWSFFAAFLVLYCSEFMPKLLCAARPLQRVLRFADAYRVMRCLLSPLSWVAIKITDMFVPQREKREQLTVDDLLRILRDRKDGVCLSDIESALISKIVVLHSRGVKITREEILNALK